MTVVYIIITILILSVLILVHEYGHFLAARLLGVRVIEFSLGMGPALFKVQKGKTQYSLRILPIGGYCRLQGEEDGIDSDESESESGEIPDYNPDENFFDKPAWKRIVILLAGVTMNFILAYIIIVIASLLSGRDFLSALSIAAKTFVEIIGLIFLSFKMLFTGEAGIDDFAGPVGMVQMVGEIYSYGIVLLLLFAAMLSINLAILNLLPIPALDGGQTLLIIIEKLKRGELSSKLKERLIITSYILLMAFAVFVAFNDIGRIIFG